MNCPISTEEEFAYVEGDTIRRVQGVWNGITLVSDGCPVPASMITTGKRIAKKNRLVVSFGGQTMIDALFRIDESKSPIEVDYLHTSGGSKGKLQLGILAWDGDTLIVNMAAPSRPRPTDFQSKAGSMQTVSNWRAQP